MNGVDVRWAHAERVSSVDLDSKGLGPEGATAVAAVLFWHAATIASLDLRCIYICTVFLDAYQYAQPVVSNHQAETVE